MHKVFSDHFARKENILTRLDARVKIIFCIAALVITLASPVVYAPLAVVAMSMFSLLAISIPFKIIIFRMGASLGIAFSILLIKVLFYHDNPNSEMLTISKLLGASSVTLFLSMTTSLDKLLFACSWFKMPRVWLEICLFAYRYIFVLLEDATTVIDAQRVRLGYSRITGTLRSVGTLAAAIIIRAYDQSVATYEAMMLRGYKGRMQDLSQEERLTLADAAAACVFFAILLSLLVLNQIELIAKRFS